MKLFLLVVNAIIFMFATTTAAHSEPITVALFGAAFAATTAGAVVSFGIGMAVSYGVSLLTAAMNKPDTPAPQGVTIEVKTGDDQPARLCIGTYATAGIRKYMGSYGDSKKTPNAFLVDVIEISNIPITGIKAMWVNDEKVTINWDNPNDDGFFPIKEYRDDGKDFMLVKFHYGNQTAVDPFLLATFSDDDDRPFNGDMIGRGCAYAIIISRVNQDLHKGQPECLFEPEPLPLYDIRKDSTNGGSGTHRWGVTSTYEPSDNPAVMIYNIARGIYYGDEWLFGGQNISAFRLPSSSWIAAANECDVQINLKDGKKEKQFRAGVEITVDMEPLQVIDDIRQACNGRMAEVGGIIKLLVGAPGAAVYSFTDDDIIVTEGQTFDPFPGLDNTFNAIEATYPEPEEKWASKNAPGLYNATLELADGQRRLASDLKFVAAPFPLQVQRLMRTMLNDYRRFRVHQFYLPPDAYQLEPNDVVSWTSSRNGYENKKFIVIEITGEATFLQGVTLRELDPADYDWDSDFELPRPVGWLGPIKQTEQPLNGWQVFADVIRDADGVARRPTIRVTCDPDQDDVRGIWIQVRLKGTAALVFDSDSHPYGEPYQWVLNGNFLPATEYEVRGKFVPFGSRPTAWSGWLAVKTENILLDRADINYQKVSQQVREDLAEFNEWITDNLRDTIDRQKSIARAAIEQDFANYADKLQLRRELKLGDENVTAHFLEEISVATGPNSSLAQSITQLNTRFNESYAEFQEALITATGPDSALAVAIRQINAVLGDASAGAFTSLESQVDSLGNATSSLIASLMATGGSGDMGKANFSIGVGAGPGGANSRIGFYVRSGSAGNWHDAGLYLDATPTGAQVAISAERFSVLAGWGDYRKVFVVDQNGLSIDTAYIRNITTAKITFLDGSVSTSAIVRQAVTDVDSFYSSAEADLTQGSTVTVADVTVTVGVGERVILWGEVNVITRSEMGNVDFFARIHRNGTAFGMTQRARATGIIESQNIGSVQDPEWKYYYGWVSTNPQVFTVMTQDTPGVGTFTYTLRVQRDTQGIEQTASTNMRFLCALVCKR